MCTIRSKIKATRSRVMHRAGKKSGPQVSRISVRSSIADLFKQVEAKVVSNSRNQMHQTRGPLS